MVMYLRYEWTNLQALIVILTREMLIKVQTSYPYNKEGFEDEMDIILQFLAGFEKQYQYIFSQFYKNRAPFTLQRICELLLDPLKHYKSSKKVLFAMEKLVNVSMST